MEEMECFIKPILAKRIRLLPIPSLVISLNRDRASHFPDCLAVTLVTCESHASAFVLVQWLL